MALIDWLFFALMLLFVELVTGTSYMLALAIGAALAWAVGMAFPEAGTSLQVISFTLGGAGSCVGVFLLRMSERPENSCILNSMVGRRFTLSIDAAKGSSKIPLGDGEWPVRLHEDLPAGTDVEVVDRDGIRLILFKTKENNQKPIQ